MDPAASSSLPRSSSLGLGDAGVLKQSLTAWGKLCHDQAPISAMKNSRTKLLVPIILITVGTGWLLTTLGVVPGIDWAWTLGLAVVGVLVLVVGGVDKVTVVVGPLFVIASALSVLRQTGRLHLDVEIPILVIVTGFLLLIVRSAAVPVPQWMVDAPKPGRSNGPSVK